MDRQTHRKDGKHYLPLYVGQQGRHKNKINTFTALTVPTTTTKQPEVETTTQGILHCLC